MDERTPLEVEDVEDDLVREIKDYLNRLDVGEDVRLHKVYGVFDDAAAVKSVTTLTIDGSSGDTTINGTEIATPGTVDIS